MFSSSEAPPSYHVIRRSEFRYPKLHTIVAADGILPAISAIISNCVMPLICSLSPFHASTLTCQDYDMQSFLINKKDIYMVPGEHRERSTHDYLSLIWRNLEGVGLTFSHWYALSFPTLGDHSRIWGVAMWLDFTIDITNKGEKWDIKPT